jgi:hypothetical protein
LRWYLASEEFVDAKSYYEELDAKWTSEVGVSAPTGSVRIRWFKQQLITQDGDK